MLTCGAENKGVSFLLENMQSAKFNQTLLGFNTIIRMNYEEESAQLVISFESDDFSGWMDATEGALEGAIGEIYGDNLTNVSDRGFDLTYECPNGITDELKEIGVNLRDQVYCATFRHIIENVPQLKKPYRYTDGSFVRVNRKVGLYLCKLDSLVATLVFNQPTNEMERELLYVFLNEFVSAKRDRKLGSAPSVVYRRDIEVPVLEFSFGERHLAKMDLVCQLLYQVPDDLEYHIKSSKTYFHHNMHEQVKAWLQNLNRADPTKDTGKGKKKAAGRKGIKGKH